MINKYLILLLISKLMFCTSNINTYSVDNFKSLKNELHLSVVCITGYYSFNGTGGLIFNNENSLEKDDISNAITISFRKDISIEEVFKINKLDGRQVKACGEFDTRSTFAIGRLSEVVQIIKI